MYVLSEKKRKARERKNEGAILKFVNISSDTISPNELHEVSSVSTSKSIPEVEEETTPGQISNNEEAGVESNISKAYAAEVGNDDIAILPNGVVSWPEPTNHDVSVELVKAAPERYLNTKGPFLSMVRFTKVGDVRKKIVLPVREMVLQDTEKR